MYFAYLVFTFAYFLSPHADFLSNHGSAAGPRRQTSVPRPPAYPPYGKFLTPTLATVYW